MGRLIYLAGPITGLTWDDATDWRVKAAEDLNWSGIGTLDPLRGKRYLAALDRIPDSQPDFPISAAKSIVTRDRMDVMRSDAILANFLGAEQPSIGTATEFGWADAYRKPVVLVMEPSGNPNDHAFIREIAGFRVETLEAGVAIVRALFS